MSRHPKLLNSRLFRGCSVPHALSGAWSERRASDQVAGRLTVTRTRFVGPSRSFTKISKKFGEIQVLIIMIYGMPDLQTLQSQHETRLKLEPVAMPCPFHTALSTRRNKLEWSWIGLVRAWWRRRDCQGFGQLSASVRSNHNLRQCSLVFGGGIGMDARICCKLGCAMAIFNI